MDSARIEADSQTVAWLTVQAEHGATLCSVCAGAFLLAEAGLLDGHVATTHWALASVFRHRYPNTHLRVEEMIVDEGNRITAGGVTAYLDLTLHLIRRYAGERVARQVGSHFLIDHRGRRQSAYQRFLPDTNHGDMYWHAPNRFSSVISVRHCVLVHWRVRQESLNAPCCVGSAMYWG